MAGVATAAMASAVSNAGGIGGVGVGNLNAEKARKMIHDIKSQLKSPSAPFHVNVFCHSPAKLDPQIEADWARYLDGEFAKFGKKSPTKLKELYKSFLVDNDMLSMLVDERPPVVSFHFGIPAQDRLQRLREAGIVLLSSATSVAEARAAVEAGMDAVIAQGWEAGGHRGVFDPEAPDERLPTLTLVKTLIDSGIELPIIAAGGIVTAEQIRAALGAGAIGVQMGTAFVASDESTADQAYRAKLQAPDARTVMVDGVSGRPARCLVNKITAVVGPDAPGRPKVPPYPFTYDAGKQLNDAARASGDSDYAAAWAGTQSALVDPMPAGELVHKLARELNW